MARLNVPFVLILLAAASPCPFVSAAWNKNTPNTRNHKKKDENPATATSRNNDDKMMADAVADDLAFAGQLAPIARKLFAPSQAKLQTVVGALKEAVNIKEFVILNLIGWTTLPLVSTVYDVYSNIVYERMPSSSSASLSSDDGSDHDTETKPEHEQVSFVDTHVYRVARDASNLARIGVLVYSFDFVAVALRALGFESFGIGWSKRVAQISYTLWAALRLSRFKHWLLQRHFEGMPDAMGRTKLWNRITNIVLSITTGAVVFDFLQLDFGMALKSLLSFGGVGALVLSLSSKDLATQLVSGVVVSTSDRFLEGDEIELGDGQAGIIERMGLAYTDLRGYDEITTRIPNSQLSNQRVRNLSRVSRSQVKQTLWFRYQDIDSMPAVCEAILHRINATCGEYAITDGSRPFRAHWRDFKDDHLEVVVDTHYNIRAATGAYWDNRQKVLEAIATAVHDMGVQFTMPSLMTYQGGDELVLKQQERSYA